MLSSNPIILETLALLLQHGVHDIVLCPGSRDAGMVHSICQIQGFRTHTATDERSAGFMAIGIADATHNPTAVVVTSGSALANLYPAACEAFYRHVPVIFISADRPDEWIGQMDGQTMPQAGALGQMVKTCAHLPMDNLWHANRLLNEALLCATAREPRGPVHINIPIAEPIYEFTATQLPQARVIRLWDEERRAELSTSYLHHPTPLHHTVILWGQMSRHEVTQVQLLEELAQHFTIIAENLSNLPPHLYLAPTHIEWTQMPRVDRVITIGGHLINKEMKEHFRRHRPQEHWHVSTDGAVADLFCCQTLAVKSTTERFLRHLIECESRENRPLELPKREDHVAEDVRIGILQRFFALLPQGAVVHLANSSTVRLAQVAMDRWWRQTAQHDSHTGIPAHDRKSKYYPTIMCNRGINGIEGSVSAAVGYAQACKDREIYIVTGDLAFFYDRNGLWTSPLPPNLHILLFNDDGGSIFHTLPLPAQPARSRDAIMGTHGLTSAEHTALQHGLTYMHGIEELEKFILTQETSLLEIYETMETR